MPCPGRKRFRVSLVPAAAFAVAAALVGCLAVEKVGPSASVVASVRVWPTSANVRVGETLQLTATPRDPAGAPPGAAHQSPFRYLRLD